jgi:hypothetical protein
MKIEIQNERIVMTNQEMTIRWMGKLAIVALPIAALFAIAPAILAYYWSYPKQAGDFSISPPIWIPFCFVTIPAIYFLCREVLNLRKRVEDLEKKINS